MFDQKYEDVIFYLALRVSSRLVSGQFHMFAFWTVKHSLEKRSCNITTEDLLLSM